MGITIKGRHRKFSDSFDTMRTNMVEDTMRIMEDVAKQGAADMRHVIETDNQTKSGPGRIDSGQMLNDVTYEVINEGNAVKARWGWLNRKEQYYFYQDEGFFNVWAQRAIPGMRALYYSLVAARERARAAFKKAGMR